LTISADGTIVLPLLTGKEEDDTGRTIITKEGTLQQVHIRLISTKKPIKVLRGHLFKSKYAPVAGIRYDGDYSVVQYSHKLDQETDLYTGRIVLERVS